MLIAWFSIIVAVIGLLIYVLAGKAEVKEIGRIMFFCGLLVALFAFGGRTTVRLP